MRIFLASILLCPTVFGQYAPIDLPPDWTFTEEAAAFAPENPEQKLGEFQPGINVEVIGRDPESAMWHVRFKRFGKPDIESLIKPPNLAKANPEAFARITDHIEAFPALKAMLEAPHPWPEDPIALTHTLFQDEQTLLLTGGTEAKPTVIQPAQITPASELWELKPLTVAINYRQPDNPRVIFEIWNKGDAYKSSINPSKAHRKIKEHLERIQEEFRTIRKDPGGGDASEAITALRGKEEVFLFPNDLRISLRYDSGEYLLLSFQSISRLEQGHPDSYDSESFEARIASKLSVSESGHRYITGIPMINQGEKGYCAAATLARVLQFYGYYVDQHALADLAETEGQTTAHQRGGTLRDNIIDAMRRITNSTPFRLRELRKAEPEAIRSIIEQGIPIIWFVPGHARLLIGIHPENDEIVYSDTWGLEHAYKVGSWDDFRILNKEMWYLEHRPER